MTDEIEFGIRNVECGMIEKRAKSITHSMELRQIKRMRKTERLIWKKGLSSVLPL
jgi:hypothetical protein